MSDVTYSADGNWWWDGQDWQPVGGSNDSGFELAHDEPVAIDAELVSELVDAYHDGAFVEIGPHATEHPLGDGAVDLTEAEISFGASIGSIARPPERRSDNALHGADMPGVDDP